jgi:hypothetical protein
VIGHLVVGEVVARAANVGEEHGQEDEAVGEAEHENAYVHAKVEHLKELRVRERQHAYAHLILAKKKKKKIEIAFNN